MEQTRNYPLLKNDFIYNKMVRFFINYNYLDILIKQSTEAKPTLPNFVIQELMYAIYANANDRSRNRGRIMDFVMIYIKKLIYDCRKVQINPRRTVYSPESTLKLTARIYEEFEARKKHILVNHFSGKPMVNVPRRIINEIVQKIYGKSASESCDNPSILLKMKNLGQRWIREQRAKIKALNPEETNSKEKNCNDEPTVLNRSSTSHQANATQSDTDLDASRSSCKKTARNSEVSSTSQEPEVSTPDDSTKYNADQPSSSRNTTTEITEKSQESEKNNIPEVVTILSSTESDDEESPEREKLQTPKKRRRESTCLSIEELSVQNTELKSTQKKLQAELNKRQKMLDEKEKEMQTEIAAVTEDNKYLMKRCKKYLRKIAKKDEVIQQMSTQLNEFYEMRNMMNKITSKSSKSDES